LFCEHCISNDVTRAMLGKSVLASVQFDNEMRFVFGEVEYVFPEGDLTAKMEPTFVPFAKLPPEQTFGIGPPVSQRTSPRDRIVR